MIPPRRWDWLLLAAGIWSVLLLVLAIHGFVRPHSHTVYTIYAAASRKWWIGQNMYAFDEEYYRYSPLFAILISPIAVLPAQLGTPVWKVVNCLFYAAGISAWARQVVPATLTRNQKAILFVLVLPVSLNSMYIGQANVVMLAAILLGLAAVRQDAGTGPPAGWLSPR